MEAAARAQTGRTDSRFKTAGGYSSGCLGSRRNGCFDPNMRPADRVTRERVAAYIAEMRAELAPYTVLCRVQELYDALRVMAPDANWEWLTQVYRSSEEPKSARCATSSRV